MNIDKWVRWRGDEWRDWLMCSPMVWVYWNDGKNRISKMYTILSVNSRVQHMHGRKKERRKNWENRIMTNWGCRWRKETLQGDRHMLYERYMWSERIGERKKWQCMTEWGNRSKKKKWRHMNISKITCYRKSHF